MERRVSKFQYNPGFGLPAGAGSVVGGVEVIQHYFDVDMPPVSKRSCHPSVAGHSVDRNEGEHREP